MTIPSTILVPAEGASRSCLPRTRRRAPRLLVLASVCMALIVGGVTSTSTQTAFAGPRTVGGELHCAAHERVAGIWMLGDQSGWHGVDMNYGGGIDNRPVVGKYSAPLKEGELIKVWIRCSAVGSRSYNETYSEFRVGRGGTRHICSNSAGPLCVSSSVAGCVVWTVLTTKNPISVWKCTRKML